MKTYACDGHLRRAKITDIKPGVILRPVNADGSVCPFSDVVVSNTYLVAGETYFNAVRPYAFAHLGTELHSVERLGHMNARSLERYKLVLTSRGQPYTCEIGY